LEAKQKELYIFTVDHFEDRLNNISPTCVSPLCAIRHVVREAIYKYMEDYCCGEDPINVFSQEDFEIVARRILSEKSK